MQVEATPPAVTSTFPRMPPCRVWKVPAVLVQKDGSFMTLHGGSPRVCVRSVSVRFHIDVMPSGFTQIFGNLSTKVSTGDIWF